MKNTAQTKDINIRIDKDTHRKLKIDSAKYGLPVKQVVAIMGEFGLKKTLSAIQEGK